MLFPIIKVIDKRTGTEHIVGTDIHDELLIDCEGTFISYYNLQNGEGTGRHGDYKFVGKEDVQFGLMVEFVSFEKLKEIYEEQTQRKKKATQALERFLQERENKRE